MENAADSSSARAIEPVLRIITLNVNGIRSAANKGLFRWLRRAEPDVVCLQEVKCDEVDIPDALRRPGDMHGFFGYSGAALFSAKTPRSVRLGFGSVEFDAEGRYVEAEFRDFTVVSVYFPSGSSGRLASAITMST
jgi:exodeoxyribonuclease-3